MENVLRYYLDNGASPVMYVVKILHTICTRLPLTASTIASVGKKIQDKAIQCCQLPTHMGKVRSRCDFSNQKTKQCNKAPCVGPQVSNPSLFVNVVPPKFEDYPFL